MNAGLHRPWYAGSVLTVGLVAGAVAAQLGAPGTGTDGGWKQHDIRRAKPPVVEPPEATTPSPHPRDAVVLFDGSDLDAWQGKSGGPAGWTVADGALTVKPGAGAIQTKAKFGDIQLHVEWASPSPPAATGQDRGNSGIFLMGRYEMQVLDSYRADTYADGQAGAIYGQYPPLFNPARPPGEWQTYDIAFRRPRFGSDGTLVEPARVTLIFNGVVVQDNESLLGLTNWLHWTPESLRVESGPIELQDHGSPVKFRNMWLRNLPERPAPSASDLRRLEVVAVPEATLDRLAGRYVMGARDTGTRVTIARAGGHLTVKFAFLPDPLVIEPTSPTTFAMPHTDGRFTFREDAQGKITAVFQIGDGERTLTKVD